MSLFLQVIRWTARLAAVLVAAGFVALAAGEILSPHSGPPTRLVEYAGIALLAVTCLGMMLAWKWELPGAALSLGALAAFLTIVRMSRYGVIFCFGAPGILFLLDWTLRKFSPAASSPLH